MVARHWTLSLHFADLSLGLSEKLELSNVEYLDREPRCLHTSIAVANHCDRARFFGFPVEIGPLVLRRNRKPDPWPCERY